MTSSMLVGDVLRNAAGAAPNRMAVVVGAEQLTFAEMLERGSAAAAGLQERGIGAGDVVLVLGTTSLDMVDLFVGCALIGAVFAPFDPRVPNETRAAVDALAQPALVLDSSADLRTDAEYTAPTLDERDPHVVFFTSGTSGTPKGVVLSHRVSVLRSHPGAQLEPRGVLVCPYPLFHMAGWTMAMQQWHARDGIVLLQQPEASEIVEAVRSFGATRLNAIPGVWQRMLDHLETAELPPLDTLRFADTGTYATPPELLAAIGAAAPNAHVRVFYGSTEVGNVTALDHGDISEHEGSCGRPSPLVELRLGASDEMLVRTPVAFDGYLNDDEATAAAFTDGWFHTGDVASIDDDGFVSIVGRLGQIIRTGGESVSPVQVEQEFLRSPLVADAAVVGVPDPQWGERVTLCVVPVAGASPTLEELLVDVDLAPHARPRRFEIVTEIPRTSATGQVNRQELLDRLP